MKTLICGPMYSGKSTALFQRLERCLFAQKRILLIRPEKDDRGYFTHSGGIDLEKLKSNYPDHFDIQLYKKYTKMDNEILKARYYDVVFVDEYFMIPGIHNLCLQMDFDVYFGGLLSTSECNLFEETIKILPYCDKIKKLNAVCQACGSELANYSFADFKKTSQVSVGDTKYKVLCQKCYTQAEMLKKAL